MKVYVSSDWHADWFTDGYERFDEIEAATAKLISGIEPGSVFIFAGDLTNPYTRNVHRAVALAVAFYRELEARSIPSLWLTGNHDIIEDGRVSHTLLALEAAGAMVADSPGVYEVGNLNVLALPYTATQQSYDPARVVEDLAAAPFPHIDFVVGHLNIEGIERGSESDEMARGRDVFWPIETVERVLPKAKKVNGHYHRSQIFRGIHIPGDLVRLTHSEEKNRPCYLVFE